MNKPVLVFYVFGHNHLNPFFNKLKSFAKFFKLFFILGIDCFFHVLTFESYKTSAYLVYYFEHCQFR